MSSVLDMSGLMGHEIHMMVIRKLHSEMDLGLTKYITFLN